MLHRGSTPGQARLIRIAEMLLVVVVYEAKQVVASIWREE
jgi:hypothetical protein